MNKANTISSIFPKHLFWDVKLDQLDAERDIHLSIPRAVLMTSDKTFEADIERLEMLYRNDEIISYLRSTKEKVSNHVCELVANRYHIPIFHRFSRR